MSSTNQDDASVYGHKLDIFLIAVGSAGAVVTIYHCIMACLCHRVRHRGNRDNRRSPELDHQALRTMVETPRSCTEGSPVIDLLIPAYKYEKQIGLVGGDGAATCAICLSEFEEGEEMRKLPECLHSYHASCIDMWLYSHSSCPMCRAAATPISPSSSVFPNNSLQFEMATTTTTQSNSAVILQSVSVQPTRGRLI